MRDVGLEEVLAELPAGLPLPVACWLLARISVSVGARPQLVTPTAIRIQEDGAVEIAPPDEVPFAHRAPEVIRGGDVDEPAAVFSLGALLVEALTGRPPFSRGSDMETRVAVTSEEVPPLSGRVAQASPALDALVAKALAKEAEERFPTPVALAEALHGFLEDELLEASVDDLVTILKQTDANQPGAAPRSAPPRSAPPRSAPPRSAPPRSAPPRSAPPRDSTKAPAKPKREGRLRADRRIGGLRKPVSAPPERLPQAQQEELDALLPQPHSLAPPTVTASAPLPEPVLPDPAPDPGPFSGDADDLFGAAPDSLEAPLDSLELDLPTGDGADEDDLELADLPMADPAPEPSLDEDLAPASSGLDIDEKALAGHREPPKPAPPPREPSERPAPRSRFEDDEDDVDDMSTAWIARVGYVLFGLLALAIVYQFVVRPLLS